MPYYSERNLLRETLEYIGSHGKGPQDIRGVYNRDGHVGSWEDFARFADQIYRAGGYGVDPGLLLMGDGWWFERGRDAGGEWWQFRMPPVLPASGAPLAYEDVFANS